MKSFTIFGYTVIKTADLISIKTNADDSKDSAVIARAKRYLSEAELERVKKVLEIKHEQIASISKKAYKNGRFVK